MSRTITAKSASNLRLLNRVTRWSARPRPLGVNWPATRYIRSLTASFPQLIWNLLFYENHAPVDFDTLDTAVPIDATGIQETGAALDGPGTAEDDSIPSIADGTFFISQGQVFNEGDTSPIGWFVDGYTTTVSEPSTLALLCISMLGIWFMRWRRIDWPWFSGGSHDASCLGASRVGLVCSTSRRGHAKTGDPEISTFWSGVGRAEPAPARSLARLNR